METIDLQVCEHCNKEVSIETMTLMEDYWFCVDCTDDFQKTFETCDHKWSSYVDNMGDLGQCCERCTGFVRDDDFPALFGKAVPNHSLEKKN